MRNILKGFLAFLLACGSTVALAAAEEVAHAPSETVSVGWVYFFLVVFFGICAWFGYAIWRADRKSRSVQVSEENT